MNHCRFFFTSSLYFFSSSLPCHELAGAQDAERLYVLTRMLTRKVLVASAMTALSYYTFKVCLASLSELGTQYALERMDPNRQKKIDAKKTSETKLGKLGVDRRELKLNEYEGTSLPLAHAHLLLTLTCRANCCGIDLA